MTTAGPPVQDWHQNPAQPGGGGRPGGPPRRQWQNPRAQYQPQQPAYGQPTRQPAYGQPPRQGPLTGPAPHPGQPAGAQAKVKPDKLVWIIALGAGFLLNAALWTPVARQTVGFGGYTESQTLMPISGGPVILVMASIAGILSLALGVMGLVVLIGKKNLRAPIAICAIAGGALAAIIPLAFPPLAQAFAESEMGGLADYNRISYTGTTWVALLLGLVVLGLGTWAMLLKARES